MSIASRGKKFCTYSVLVIWKNRRTKDRTSCEKRADELLERGSEVSVDIRDLDGISTKDEIK